MHELAAAHHNAVVAVNADPRLIPARRTGERHKPQTAAAKPPLKLAERVAMDRVGIVTRRDPRVQVRVRDL